MRCPNSTTNTTTGGKSPANTIVLDGVTYAPVVEERPGPVGEKK
jgi:hypothetical protein